MKQPMESDMRGSAGSRLERMIEAARATPETGLSGESRGRILREALHDGEADEALPALFTPTRRLLVAGALPVLLAVGLLVGIFPGKHQTTASHPASIAVSKQGDQVLFTIRNGDRAHRVVRSSQPDRFDGSEGVAVTDGSYAEGLSDGSDLVFYRID